LGTFSRTQGRARLEVVELLKRARSPQGPLREKLFRYARYNAELTPEGLRDLGCGDIKPEHVQKMDSVEFIPALQRVGKAAADRNVDRAHFNFAVFRP
jgi:hypothetical protein